MNDLEVREEMRSHIELAYQRSLPRLYWGTTGRILARIFGRSGEAPMWLIGLVAYGLVFAAVSVVGYLLDQPLSPSYSVPLSVYTWLCAVVFDAQVRQMIHSLKHDLVDLFDLEAGPVPLGRWLRFSNSLPLQLAWLVFCIVNMGFLTVIIVYNQNGQQAGAIVYIFTGLIFLQFLTHFYWLFLLAITFAPIALPPIAASWLARSIAWADSGDATLEPVWVTPDGRVTPVGMPPGTYRWPRVSPDGARVVSSRSARGFSIAVTDLARHTTTRLDGSTEPVWSPDGSRVFMCTGNRPAGGLVGQVADGSRPPDTLLVLDRGDSWPTSTSPDGQWLAYYGATLGSGDEGDAGDPHDLFFLDLTNRESRGVRLPGSQRGARFSPGGYGTFPKAGGFSVYRMTRVSTEWTSVLMGYIWQQEAMKEL